MIANNSKSPTASWLQLRRNSALYAGGTAALGVFIALLTLCPAPIDGYLSKGIVEQRVTSSPEGETDLQLLSESQVRDIAAEMLRASEQKASSPSTKIGRDRAVQVNGVAAASDSVRFQIIVRSRYADQSRQLCRKIMEEVVARQPQLRRPGEAEHQSRRDDVSRRLALVRESIHSLEDETSRITQERLKAMSLAVQSPTAVELPAVDPIWQAARDRLTQLEEQLRQMLVTRTEEHPQVVEAGREMELARRELAAIPQFSSPPQTVAKNTNADSDAALADAQYEARLRELEQSRFQARSHREQLEEESQRLAVPVPSIQYQTQVVAAAEIFERLGGRPNAMRIAMYAVVSLLAGLAMGVPAHCVLHKRTSVAADVTDVELALPVVARIPCVSILDVHREQVMPPEETVASFAGAGEFVLATTLVLIVYYMTQSQPLSVSPVEDPFGAVAETFDRVGEIRLR